MSARDRSETGLTAVASGSADRDRVRVRIAADRTRELGFPRRPPRRLVYRGLRRSDHTRRRGGRCLCPRLLGIGAGWAQSEYKLAGIPFDAGSIRVRRLEESLYIIKGLFAKEPLNFSGNYYTVSNLEGFPKPIQRPHPPIFVGGGSKRILSIAAREANIVGFGPRTRADGSGLDTTDATAEATERKVAWVRQAAGERFNELELNAIVFTVVVTDQRQQASEQLTQRFQMTAQQVLEMPHCLLGTVDQITEDLLYRREKFGISYISVFDESMEAFAPVVARLAGK